jgi:hypothetical protein
MGLHMSDVKTAVPPSRKLSTDLVLSHKKGTSLANFALSHRAYALGEGA